MLACLEASSLFSELDVKSITDIAKFSHYKIYQPGDILITENQNNSHDLFIIRSGNIEIVTNSKDFISEEIPISRQDREIIGEISWLTRQKRSATIRCSSEVEAVCIDGDKLEAYLESRPVAGHAVMKQIARFLANRLNQSNILLKQILWNGLSP